MILAILMAVQAAVPPKPVPAPTLSSTEQLAARSLREDINQVRIEIGNFEAEIIKNHPGYRFDFQSGTLVVIPAPVPKPAIPTPKVDKK